MGVSFSESISDPQLMSAGFRVLWASGEGAGGNWEPWERVSFVIELF